MTFLFDKKNLGNIVSVQIVIQSYQVSSYHVFIIRKYSAVTLYHNVWGT